MAHFSFISAALLAKKRGGKSNNGVAKSSYKVLSVAEPAEGVPDVEELHGGLVSPDALLVRLWRQPVLAAQVAQDGHALGQLQGTCRRHRVTGVPPPAQFGHIS